MALHTTIWHTSPLSHQARFLTPFCVISANDGRRHRLLDRLFFFDPIDVHTQYRRQQATYTSTPRHRRGRCTGMRCWRNNQKKDKRKADFLFHDRACAYFFVSYLLRCALEEKNLHLRAQCSPSGSRLRLGLTFVRFDCGADRLHLDISSQPHIHNVYAVSQANPMTTTKAITYDRGGIRDGAGERHTRRGESMRSFK